MVLSLSIKWYFFNTFYIIHIDQVTFMTADKPCIIDRCLMSSVIKTVYYFILTIKNKYLFPRLVIYLMSLWWIVYNFAKVPDIQIFVFEYISSLALKRFWTYLWKWVSKIAVCKYAVAVKSMCVLTVVNIIRHLLSCFRISRAVLIPSLLGQKNIKENNIKMTVSNDITIFQLFPLVNNDISGSTSRFSESITFNQFHQYISVFFAVIANSYFHNIPPRSLLLLRWKTA